ncbi:hypothetical protein [Enterococcus avium]|nr:hypothetical protein [Enterococcus avium]MDT2383522.1 hypothetical protein [Enterococcus avium]
MIKDLFKATGGCLTLALGLVIFVAILMAVIKVVVMMWQIVF